MNNGLSMEIGNLFCFIMYTFLIIFNIKVLLNYIYWKYKK